MEVRYDRLEVRRQRGLLCMSVDEVVLGLEGLGQFHLVVVEKGLVGNDDEGNIGPHGFED